MFFKLIKKDKKSENSLYFLLCLLIAIAVSIPLLKYSDFHIWGSWGDYDFSLIPSKQLSAPAYTESYGGGYYAPFNIANKLPYLLILSLFSFLKISPFISTLVYVMLFNFLSSIFTFMSFRYFSQKITSKENAFLAFLLSLTYVYSPYFSTFYKSGHFMITFSFLFFPVILMYYDKILESDKNGFENYLILFLFFSLLSSSISNIAYLVVYLLSLGLYFIGFILYKESVKIKYIVSSAVVCLLLFLSNFWWFLSNIVYYIKTYTAQIAYSRDTIGRYIGSATDKSSLDHLLFSGGIIKYETSFAAISTVLTTLIYIVLFGIVLFLIINSNKKQLRYLLPFLVLMFFSLFIVKGSKAPYGNIFSYLYEKIPGFQIFRRPDSKMYWLYLFGLNLVTLLGLQQVLPKLNSLHRKLAMISLSILTFSVLFLYSSNTIIVPFNIPSSYYEANDIFKSENATRILILPDINGLPPYYDDTLNGLRGYDFIPQVWKYELLGYDLYNKLSLNDDLNTKLQKLYANLSKDSSVCLDFKELGISHVVFKQNLTNDFDKIINGFPLEETLSQNADFKYERKFLEGESPLFTVWSVKDSCRISSPFPFSVNGLGVSISYNKISPTYYEIKLQGISKDTLLSFMRGYDKDWRLYLLPGDYEYKRTEFLLPMDAISGSIKTLKNYQRISGYTNDWLLRVSDLSPYLEDSKEVTLVLNYFPSIFLYMGIMISSATLLTLVVLTFCKHFKRRGV